MDLLLRPEVSPSEEDITSCAENLRRYRGMQGLHATYEVPADETIVENPEEAEEYAELQARVVARLAAGTLSYDDPDYQKYCRLNRRLRGQGRYDLYPPTGPCAGGPSSSPEETLSGADPQGS